MPHDDCWTPLRLDEIQPLLGDFERWCLCGGVSIDLLLGRKTREHGDTDIGVFRSNLDECLTAIGRARVFLCDPPGELAAWHGEAVPERVHDIWIADADGEHWVLQILVFDDDETHVYYKRDRSIRWSKASHTQQVDGRPVLNPLITFLHKSHRDLHEPKDLEDLRRLVDECTVSRRRPASS
jgi:aminoglycoside-2''-adenylyltransferase